ncbi:MAG: hypothetical protein ACLFXM_12160 [Acidimicrobiia bacterium]
MTVGILTEIDIDRFRPVKSGRSARATSTACVPAVWHAGVGHRQAS